MRVEPTPPSQIEVKNPKKKRLKKVFIIAIIVIIIAIPVVALGTTGFLKIPGLSHLFGTSQPKELGVVVSEAARNELLENVGFEIETGENFIPFGNRTYQGEIEVDLYSTSEQITSFLQLNFPEHVPTQSLQVNLIEGGFEASVMIERPVKMPVYAQFKVDLIDERSVDLTLEKGNIGIIPVPKGYLEKAEEWIENKVNERLAQIPGLSIEVLEYYDGRSHFKGILPAKISPAEGEWLNI